MFTRELIVIVVANYDDVIKFWVGTARVRVQFYLSHVTCTSVGVGQLT